jgi:hypothetical protein
LSSQTFDGDALRADWAAARGDSDAPPAAPPPEPSPEPQAPQTEPDDVPAAPPPAAPPEGAPPGDQAPASDDTLNFAAKLAGSTDPAVLAAKLVEYNNRLAQIAREQKAAAQQQPQATPTQAPSQPPPPAPPAAEMEPTPQVVQREVDTWAATDAECVRLHSDYHQNRARLDQLGIDHKTGRISEQGEIARIESVINLLTLYTDPKARQHAGVEVPDLDEFKQQEMRIKLAEARSERTALLSEARHRREYMRDLYQSYDHRLDQARRAYLEPYAERRREADREAAIEERTQEFAQSFRSEFDNTYNRYAVQHPWIKDPEIREDFLRAVTTRAKADVSQLDNVGGFMDQAFKNELAIWDRVHRNRSRGYAVQKLADGRPQAPNGSGAVAPPLPTSKTDWEAALRAEVRGIRGNLRQR